MAERIIEVNGRRMRVGTAEDAGRICVTKRKPHGMTAKEYRWRLDNRKDCPGPIMVANPYPAEGDPTEVPLLIEGVQQFDLDAVAHWHKSRPGAGGWQNAHATPETLKSSPVRELVLTAARDARLTVNEQGHTLIDGQRQNARVAQMRTGLQQLGLLGEPAGPNRGRRVPLTELGDQVLTRWGLAPSTATTEPR